MSNLWAALAISTVAAFALALVSAVAGFGGGALLLPVFTGLFGLRIAVPVLTLTQIASNGGRVPRTTRSSASGPPPGSARPCWARSAR